MLRQMDKKWNNIQSSKDIIMKNPAIKSTNIRIINSEISHMFNVKMLKSLLQYPRTHLSICEIK